MNLKPKYKFRWHELIDKRFVAVYIALALVLVINQMVFSFLLKDRELAKAADCGDGIGDCTCGDTVMADYTLTADLDCTGTGGNGLIIGADNITIDGSGHTIDGHIRDIFAGDASDFVATFNEADPRTWQWGIYSLEYDNVTIKNLHIANFFGGIVLGSIGPGVTGITIQDNIITNDVYYNMSFVTPPAMYLNAIDTISIAGNDISGFGMPIYLSAISNGAISSNTITGGWGNGVHIINSSSNLDIENNTIRSSFKRGLTIESGCLGITLDGNTFMYNRIDFNNSEPTVTFTGNTYAHGIESPLIGEWWDDIPRNIGLNDTVDFKFGLLNSFGSICPLCSYNVLINPPVPLDVVFIADDGLGRPAVFGSFDAIIPGTYSLQIEVSDGTNTAYRNKMFYVDPVGSEVSTYYFRAKEDAYPRAGFNSVHGQPKGRDDGAFTLTRPTETETELCSKFVLNTVDELPNYPIGLVTGQNLSFYHKEDEAMTAGLVRFGANGGSWDAGYTQAIAQSPDNINYVYSSGEADFPVITNWAMDYPYAWYLLSFQFGRIVLFGDPFPIRNPFIQSRPEPDPNPSTNIITHIYTTTPAVKSLSNPDVLMLSANPSEPGSPLATLVLDGTYAADHSVDVAIADYNYAFGTAITRINSDGTAMLRASNVTAKTVFDSVNMALAPDTGYVDTEIIFWNVAGDYSKKWTENTTTPPTTVNHIVGNLVPASSYSLKVNGTVIGTFTANGTGEISFDYTSYDSLKTFEVVTPVALGGLIPDITPPGDVTDLKIGADALGKVTMSWVDPVDSDLREIVILETAAPQTDSIIVNKGVQTVVLYNLIIGRTYTFIVKARDIKGLESQGVSQTIIIPLQGETSESTEPIELPIGVTEGELVRNSSSPAVYYIGPDHKKHVFIDETIYKTWYSDFSEVNIISSSTLALVVTGKEVRFREGTYLLKKAGDSKVYALLPGGNLSWIKNESIATALYGNAWAKKVLEIPDAMFSQYTISSKNIESAVHPDASLIMYPGNAAVFYIENGSRHYISAQIWSQSRFQDRFISKNIDSALTYPAGPALAAMTQVRYWE
ncbi:MAG: right-handed parallel beta-helix repeat-containing protein [Desulfobacula sp.]